MLQMPIECILAKTETTAIAITTCGIGRTLVSFSPLEEEGKEERRLPGDIILAKVICCQVDCRHHSHRRRELPYRRVVSVIPEILWGNPRHLSYSLRDTTVLGDITAGREGVRIILGANSPCSVVQLAN